MLGKKGSLIVAILFLAAVFLTGRARLALDAIVAPLRDSFQEMIYLPRGDGLKILACGFEAPLADALFIKSLIYYAESLVPENDPSKSRKYTYELFDVITDLSPRFARAYQTGSLFLTASALHTSVLDGVKLLDKGVTTYERLAKEGQPADPDARWLFHTLLATTYDVNIQSYRRTAGDLVGASEARQTAAKEFRLAAASPHAPEYVILAAAGYASVVEGKGNIEDSQSAVLSIWHELYDQAVARGDKEMAQDLEKRIAEIEEYIKNITDTRAIERFLSDAGRRYLQTEKKPPVGVADLLKAKLLPGRPRTPLATEEHPDSYLALPDGSFKSRTLSEMETSSQLDLLLNAVINYRKVNGKTPPTPQSLIDGKFLDRIPDPPLKEMGQTYEFDSQSGLFTNLMPELPELPPDRQ